MDSVKLDRYTICNENSPLFMAEIGTFFNKDIVIAEEYVRQIEKSGAEIVKGEILHTAEICLRDDTVATYFSHKDGVVSENYRDLIERKVVSLDEYGRLFGLCRDLDIPFVLSVYDFKGADFAVDIGAAALKIASSNIVHAPLVRHVAKKGKPVFVDTGKSSLEEICRVIQWVKDAGCEDIIVEHSPLPMPFPLRDHHLRMIPTLKELFGIPVGLSDHYQGNEMMYAAVALGVNVIEKPVCTDPTKPEQDAYWALPISELKTVVEKCRKVYEALGSNIRPIQTPRDVPSYRMGLVAKIDIHPGMKIDLNTVTFSFPAKGIPVENWDLVGGKHFARAVRQGDTIHLGDINFD